MSFIGALGVPDKVFRVVCPLGLPVKAAHRLDELGQLGEAVVPGVEVGLLLHQQVAQLAHVGKAVLAAYVLHRLGDELRHIVRDPGVLPALTA